MPSTHLIFQCRINFQTIKLSKPSKYVFILLHKTIRNEAEIAFQEGKENLEILKRQVVLGSLYPSAPSVMEMENVA